MDNKSASKLSLKEKNRIKLREIMIKKGKDRLASNKNNNTSEYEDLEELEFDDPESEDQESENSDNNEDDKTKILNILIDNSKSRFDNIKDYAEIRWKLILNRKLRFYLIYFFIVTLYIIYTTNLVMKQPYFDIWSCRKKKKFPVIIYGRGPSALIVSSLLFRSGRTPLLIYPEEGRIDTYIIANSNEVLSIPNTYSQLRRKYVFNNISNSEISYIAEQLEVEESYIRDKVSNFYSLLEVDDSESENKKYLLDLSKQYRLPNDFLLYSKILQYRVNESGVEVTIGYGDNLQIVECDRLILCEDFLPYIEPNSTDHIELDSIVKDNKGHSLVGSSCLHFTHSGFRFETDKLQQRVNTLKIHPSKEDSIITDASRTILKSTFLTTPREQYDFELSRCWDLGIYPFRIRESECATNWTRIKLLFQDHLDLQERAMKIGSMYLLQTSDPIRDTFLLPYLFLS